MTKLPRTLTVLALTVTTLILLVVPGTTDEPLSCDDGELGGVFVMLVETGSPGEPTPRDAANAATGVLDLPFVETLEISQVGPQVLLGEAPDFEARIHVVEFSAGGYGIESIEYCYTGPPVGPVQLDDTK